MAHCNPGVDFNPEWFNKIRIDLPALKRRAGDLGKKRSVKKAHQAAWLCRAVTGTYFIQDCAGAEQKYTCLNLNFLKHPKFLLQRGNIVWEVKREVFRNANVK